MQGKAKNGIFAGNNNLISSVCVIKDKILAGASDGTLLSFRENQVHHKVKYHSKAIDVITYNSP